MKKFYKITWECENPNCKTPHTAPTSQPEEDIIIFLEFLKIMFPQCRNYKYTEINFTEFLALRSSTEEFVNKEILN